MSYNYQDALTESQQEYFVKVNTDNKETLYNALKRIAELEKENEELRKNGFTVSAMTEQQLKVALEKGEQLEKDFRICEQNADTYYDQLVKAKEIIKDLMSFSVQLCDSRHTVDFEKTREQAEQFLKEIEK